MLVKAVALDLSHPQHLTISPESAWLIGDHRLWAVSVFLSFAQVPLCLQGLVWVAKSSEPKQEGFDFWAG